MCISFPPYLTMMHLCITQCTYWTPLLTIRLRHSIVPVQRHFALTRTISVALLLYPSLGLAETVRVQTVVVGVIAKVVVILSL